MFDQLAKIRPTIEYRFWACLGHEGQTLQDLVQKMHDLGNEVLEIDADNQRVLVRRHKGIAEDVWGCRICLAEGQIVIVDTEQELILHCDEVHPQWRDL